MRRILLCAAASGVLVAGCGGGGDAKPTVKTKADWISAADRVCQAYLDDTDNAGIQGTRPVGVAKEFGYLSDEMRTRLEGLKGLDKPAAIKPAINGLIGFYDHTLKTYENVASAAGAARPGNVRDPAVGKALAALDTDASAAGTKLSKQLGTRVCGKVPPDAPPRPAASQFEGATGLPHPNGPAIQQAVQSYLEAGLGGQCASFIGFAHSDDRRLSPAQCNAAGQFLKGGRLAATRQFGPVGVYDYLTAAGSYNSGYFVYDANQGGELRKAGDVNLTLSSLRKPPPGADAQKTFESVVEAIRDNDPGKLREAAGGDLPPADALTPTGKFDRIGISPSGRLLVLKLRADDKAEPRLLAITQGYAFATVAPGRDPFLLVAVNGPGKPGHYGFVGFYPLFPTSGQSG